jgi:hypothetical protein
MIFRGRRWLTLGKAAKLLGTSRKSLWLQLTRQPEHGFTVLEKVDRVGRVWRYLAEDEIRQTLGESDVSVPERASQVIRIDAKTGAVVDE